MRVGPEKLRFFRAVIFLLFAVGTGALANAQEAESPRPGAEEQEPVPVEPFASLPDQTFPPITMATIASEEASSPVVVDEQQEHFSLWDFVSRFFELGAPGDPNNRDKLRFTLASALGYDTNVLTSNTDPIASTTSSLSGTVAYNFGSDRLKINAGLGIGATYYDNRPGDSTDYNGNFNAAVSYYVNRRLQISGTIGLVYASQPNPTLIGGVTRFSGDYTVTNGSVSVSYSLRPRLSMRLEYRQNAIEYANASSNEGLGFNEQTYVLGFDYLVSPRITLTTEYRYSPLFYNQPGQDSTGQIFTVGFITAINPRLTWTLQAGVEGRTFSDSSPQGGENQYFGPFLESNAEYNFAPGSSILATLRYGTEPSGIASLAIRETLRGSLAFRYAFTPRFIGDLMLAYQNDHYNQPGEINDFSQQFFTGSFGLAFQINPALSLNARYEYSVVQSDIEGDGYTRGISSLGLQIIF